MSTEVLAGKVEQAAKAAGLQVISTAAGESAAGPTVKFALALAAGSASNVSLELGANYDAARPELAAGLNAWLTESATRLRNPRPDCAVTLLGLPLAFGRFEWPFHHSTSGADTSLVHGEVHLADGTDTQLHAKVSASMTVTFQEAVVPAPEQPLAEGFVYNAVRKTMDQGQLELVKSGNRQPVPLTTRYYLPKIHKFTFNETNEAQRKEFLAAKAYWLSGILGGKAPVWMVDPRDAQYLDTSTEELARLSALLAHDGLVQPADTGFASATAKLMDRRDDFLAQEARMLAFIKPSFNEDMRAGLTNM
ncbi:MAG TPA: hypothetical protein VN612_10610 [Acidobacteriaceae bacterium]|nr:hypothetical protein [Acidobacteriaceae bacterium]